MKLTGECPKCGGSNILVAAGWSGPERSGHYIPLPGIHMWSDKVLVDRYICGDCGYIEEWITRDKDLERVNKHLPRL